MFSPNRAAPLRASSVLAPPALFADRRKARERRVAVERRQQAARRDSDFPFAATMDAWPRLLRHGATGLALALVVQLAMVLLGGEEALRTQAALVAVSGFVYLAAAIRVGSLPLFLVGILTLPGFFFLAQLALSVGEPALSLGFWLHGVWALMLGLATRSRMNLTLLWACAQLGQALLLGFR